MPIKIDFLANVRDFVRGTQNAEDALDDVADSLDDMARDAKRGGDDAERAVEKLEKTFDEAAKSAKDLGDDSKDAGRDVERGFRDAARRAKDLGDAGEDAGRDVKRGMDDASEGLDEFKDEANSTAREAAASFDGSIESIVDGFQEVAANALGGFGPAGVAAGLAAAAGIGLAVKGFEEFNEAEQASEERAAEWADAYIEAGSRILDASQIVESARAIITDPEQYEAAKKNATDWGVSESVALLAMAGDTNALTEARDALAKKEASLAGELERAGGDRRNLTYDERKHREEVQNGTASLELLSSEMNRGSDRADIYSSSLRLLAQHTEGATREVDELGDTIVTLPDGKKIYIDAETGRATDNVDAIENKIYGIRDKTVDVNVRANLGGATSAYERWIARNNGRSIKIYGKYVSPPGSDVWP